jgi:putative peptidoglycan lipid II flippase
MKFPFLGTIEFESINRKIFRAALIIGSFTIVVRIGSTVKELAVAKSFGRGDALDTFLIAYLLPSFVVGLVLGSLGAALVPTFIEIRHNRGVEAAQKLFSSMMLLSLVILVPVMIILGLLAPYYLPYIGSGFSPAKLHLTCELLYMLLPFVFFSGITVCASAGLNAGEKFALPSLIPLVSPLTVILFIALRAQNWGPFSLAAGTVAGSFLEAVILTWALRANGIRPTLRWYGLDPGVRSVLRQFTPTLAGSFLMGSTLVVDQSMAAMLHEGSVGALSYANKIITVFSGIGAMALGTPALAYFSKMVAHNDWNGCRHTLKRYSILIVLATVPLTLGLIIFSEPLVRVLFQRGAFTNGDTRLVSSVLICYSIQIPFYVWGMLFVKFLSSVRRNDILMYGAAISFPLDIVLNLVLMRVWGVAGIALSTSLVYAASLLYLGTCSLRLLAKERWAIVAQSQQ